MNQTLKRKWVKALLSGKYQQDTGALKCGRFYCCLGVLREVADKHDTRSRSNLGTWLDSDQLTEFGLSVQEQLQLGFLNDHGVPFEMIAGFIQETL